MESHPPARPEKRVSRKAMVLGAAVFAGALLGALFLRKDPAERNPTKNKPPEPDASDSALPPDASPATFASAIANLLDAGKPKKDTHPTDAGVSSCRLLFGPKQQWITGPGALHAKSRTLSVIVQKAGVPLVHTESIAPKAKAHAEKQSFEGKADIATSPVCAVTDTQIFCNDASGLLHRTQWNGNGALIGNGSTVTRTSPGTRPSALNIALNGMTATILAYERVRKTSEGEVLESYARLSGDNLESPEKRLSDDGSGATDTRLIPTSDGAVAVSVDARIAMSPVHGREIHVKPKAPEADRLQLGKDQVLFVGGGMQSYVWLGASSIARDRTYVLLPHPLDQGFGLSVIEVSDPPAVDETATDTLYGDGMESPHIEGTIGTKRAWVVRMIPEPGTGRKMLELGEIRAGKFVGLGGIQTSGSVKHFSLAEDLDGAIWVYYTDNEGSWLERRDCP